MKALPSDHEGGNMSLRTSRGSRFLATLGMIGGLILAVPAISGAVSGGTAKASTVQPATCTVDQKLVPTCTGQALFGAFINHYPGVTGWENQMNAGVERYKRDIPVWHNYHSYERPRNAIPLDPATVDGAAERRFAMSGGIPWPLWKPVEDWSTAVASTNPNDPEDRLIRQAAGNIKSVAPHKVFFSIHGEPENDVSGGGHCTQYKGKTPGNTPANYRAMWSNVHRIFAQEHVPNVVWVMDYMGYSQWECLWKDMWPGNDLVDWVAYDPYSDGRRSWDDTIGQFYGWLNTHSDTAHAFRSKPYMVGEFGVHGTNQQFVYQWYEDGKKALDRRAFPNVRAYVVFDSCGNGYDSRTGYVGSATIDTCTTMPDPTEQEHFNTLIKDPALRPVVRN
jgi:hypothetical protein